MAAEAAPRSEAVATIEWAEEAASRTDLDEAETRALIDAQLRDAGWEADSKWLRHSEGARSSKANRAIAEWPTRNGAADYALIVGTTLIGLVGAKRRRKNVSAAIGRSYLRQVETEGGIWFRDTRRPANHRRALVSWTTSDGLAAKLEIDRDAARLAYRKHLKQTPTPCWVPLRYGGGAVLSALKLSGAWDLGS